MLKQTQRLISPRRLLTALSIGSILAAGLMACGGGAGSASSGNPMVASSTGTITAFGSVFVNGHEFGTGRARFIDDDGETTTASATGLEVGMVVDVTPAAGSTTSAPEAGELHLHPLVRGYVDAVDTSAASTLTVMGQKVQVNSSTNFSDHRACALAATPTCTPVSSLSLLTATTSAAAPGTYVTVHGYLFSGASGGTNVVATLISATDLPVINPSNVTTPSSGTVPPNHVFKVEGPLTLTGSVPSIGGLTLDFSTTTCKVAGTVTPCTTAFTAGQVIAVGSATAPVVPATTFAPTAARRAAKLPMQTVGQSIEVEGVVSSVTSSTSSFVVRGITVDATTLGATLPAAGDLVEVEGTVTGTAQSISATKIKIIHAAASVSVDLQGDVDTASITGSGTAYSFTLLGQTVNVTAQTRLADMSTRTWDHGDPAANPFNISTFATYLGASTSKHLIVRTEADTTGRLTALSVAIVPASTVAGLSGIVDASPAVSNSSVTGTPTTFAIHGVSVSADPAAIYKPQPRNVAMQTVVAGEKLVVLGTYTNNVLTVGATTTTKNIVMDIGVPTVNLQNRSNF